QSIPLLKGKSAHGSNPTTVFPFTLSWMPHCWPQKQQWVLTSRSGSADVSSRSPDWYARSGPNFASSSGVAGGSVARRAALGRFRFPGRVLGEGEHLPPARRADALVVPALLAWHLVVIPQLRLDLNQVLHVGGCGERLVAARAPGRRLLRADVAVELDRELGRPLEDVEELAERQPEQGEDDRDRVQERQELVPVPL